MTLYPNNSSTDTFTPTGFVLYLGEIPGLRAHFCLRAHFRSIPKGTGTTPPSIVQLSPYLCFEFGGGEVPAGAVDSREVAVKVHARCWNS